MQLATTVARRQVKEKIVRTTATISETKNAYIRSLAPTLALAVGGLFLLLLAFGFLLSAVYSHFLIADQTWALAAGFGTGMFLFLSAAGIWFKTTNPARRVDEIKRRVDETVAQVRKDF